MRDPFYTSPEWSAARDAALQRDGSRCTVARLIGGDCSHVLDVHHLVPRGEGGAALDPDNLITLCHVHHPMVERLRRQLLRAHTPRRRRCRHEHRTTEARLICERRLNRLAA